MKLLEELVDVQGGAGYEDLVQAIVVRELEPCVDEIYEDRIGNIIAVKRATQAVDGDRPLRVMVCAHCDECGFMVREVTDAGYVRLRGVSGPNNQTVIGQQIRIAGTEAVCGVLVPTSQHLTIFPKIEELLVHRERSSSMRRRPAASHCRLISLRLQRSASGYSRDCFRALTPHSSTRRIAAFSSWPARAA